MNQKDFTLKMCFPYSICANIFLHEIWKISYLIQEHLQPHFPVQNLENIFHARESVSILSSMKYGKFHVPCRKICAHNFLHETWKILIEVINIFRKMNLHFLILSQVCQKHTENGHKKSHLCRI